MLQELEDFLNSRVESNKTVIIERTAFVRDTWRLGDNTHVWHNAQLGEGVETGPNCVIGSNVYIGKFSKLGHDVRIQHGAFLPDHSQIGNCVFIGPNVTMTDDKFPRVNNPGYTHQPPVLANWCSIGAGAVLLPGVRIGEYAVVGAGAVVTRNVPADAIVTGNPARIYGTRG